jgi:chemotaxis protein MotB
LSEALALEQAALVAARSDFADEKAALLKDKSRLRASMEELSTALESLEERRRSAEARVAAFRDLLDRFSELIDAGTLEVKILDGRMVVQMATDILFASGRADLSVEGVASLAQVAAILSAIPERSYQVEGHTDDVPIQTQRFPSNWELASARAVGVAQHLIDGGVLPGRVSAAAFGEHRPVASNDTADGRAANRRIEIVVMPDLSDLPGSDELGAL